MNEAQRRIYNQSIEQKRLSVMFPFDLTKLNSQQGEEASVRKHDCWHYTECVYKIGTEGTAKMCQTCEKILEFRYRSFWKRLLRVFTDF